MEETRRGVNNNQAKAAKKPQDSVCFVPQGASLLGVASACVTSNHWSDEVTSVASVDDVYVPYYKRTIERLRGQDPAACKPYGEQVCVLVVDVW